MHISRVDTDSISSTTYGCSDKNGPVRSPFPVAVRRHAKMRLYFHFGLPRNGPHESPLRNAVTRRQAGREREGGRKGRDPDRLLWCLVPFLFGEDGLVKACVVCVWPSFGQRWSRREWHLDGDGDGDGTGAETFPASMREVWVICTPAS